MLPKICKFWLKFESKLSKYLVLELTGDHFSSSEHIYCQHMGILPSLQFSGQRLMHWLRCISVTSKTVRHQWEAWNWSCDLRANDRPRIKLHPMAQANKLPDKETNRQTDGHRNSMTESAQWGWFRENQCLSPTLVVWLIHRIDINHQECWHGRHPALGRMCYAKWLQRLFQIDQISHFTLSKTNSLTRPRKMNYGWLILFQLLNLHLWQAAHCTLHTAHYKLRPVPAPANAHETASIHFILHIEHFALHTIHLFCMLHIYYFTRKHPKLA